MLQLLGAGGQRRPEKPRWKALPAPGARPHMQHSTTPLLHRSHLRLLLTPPPRKVRYMDSKDEEQARGITMKSSSISLLFVPGAALRPEGPNSVPLRDKLEQGGRWVAGGLAAVGGLVGWLV